MVAAVRRGDSLRAVAKRFHVSLSVVQRWVKRAGDVRLDRVDWSDRSRAAHRVTNRTPTAMETRLIDTRQQLRDHSPLGEYGADAVRLALTNAGVAGVPSVRTIGRVFERYGLLDAARKPRRKAPPKGWYLHDVAAGRAEVDSFDIVQGLKIAGGPLVEVFNGVSFHGGLVASWPQKASVKATDVVSRLTEHWREVGLPDYAQFDNDTLFQGPHQYTDVVGRVMRLCLSLGVVPIFAPVREQGFQAAIEDYNGLWQAKVWARCHHSSLSALEERSTAYVLAHRHRSAARREAAPERHPFPADWQLDLQAHPGDGPVSRVVYIRRTDQHGRARLLGRSFEVVASWASRLVRCEVDFAAGRIGIHRLRRRDPLDQPLLCEHEYRLPRRPFAG
jgi:hypothetical protein